MMSALKEGYLINFAAFQFQMKGKRGQTLNFFATQSICSSLVSCWEEKAKKLWNVPTAAAGV